LGACTALSSISLAVQRDPGSGAVAMLTVLPCTQRYTVRACAGPQATANNSTQKQAGTRIGRSIGREVGGMVFRGRGIPSEDAG
jgi:hypothetical protein